MFFFFSQDSEFRVWVVQLWDFQKARLHLNWVWVFFPPPQEIKKFKKLVRIVKQCSGMNLKNTPRCCFFFSCKKNPPMNIMMKRM